MSGSVVEMSPVFGGKFTAAEEFLQRLGIPWPEVWTLADTQTTFTAWDRYVTGKRQGNIPKRPIADVLIGAFASRFQGLLTRNAADFRPLFATLTIVDP